MVATLTGGDAEVPYRTGSEQTATGLDHSPVRHRQLLSSLRHTGHTHERVNTPRAIARSIPHIPRDSLATSLDFDADIADTHITFVAITRRDKIAARS